MGPGASYVQFAWASTNIVSECVHWWSDWQIFKKHSDETKELWFLLKYLENWLHCLCHVGAPKLLLCNKGYWIFNGKLLFLHADFCLTFWLLRTFNFMNHHVCSCCFYLVKNSDLSTHKWKEKVRCYLFFYSFCADIWKFFSVVFGNISLERNKVTEKWLHCWNFATNPSFLGKISWQRKLAHGFCEKKSFLSKIAMTWQNPEELPSVWVARREKC